MTTRALTHDTLAPDAPVHDTPAPDAPTTGSRLPRRSPADSTRPVPELGLGRAVVVDLRKLVNTRAHQAIIAGGTLLMAAFAGGRALVPSAETSVADLPVMALAPAGWMVMVLAVLLVSAEFSRRTVETSLVLDPRRGRFVAGKLLALLVAVVALLALALVLGLGAGLVAPLLTGHALPWSLDAQRFALAAGSLLFVALTGLAWALLTRNAPAPIVVLLLWPALALLVTSFSEAAGRVLQWVNIEPVWSLSDPSPLVLARFATSALVWIVLPGAIGTWRLAKGDL